MTSTSRKELGQVAHEWGAFSLSTSGEKLSLRDRTGNAWLWEPSLRSHTPLRFNWFVVAVWFKHAAVEGRERPLKTRKKTFIGHAVDRRIRKWAFETRALAFQIGRQRHWVLESKMADVADEIEYERGQGTFGFTGYGDYGVTRCLTAAIPNDPARRCDLYADCVLWAFNEFRLACDRLMQTRSSLETLLQRLLEQVPDSDTEKWFPSDISATVKRIQRVRKRIRKGQTSSLVEAVLRQVTEEGALEAHGGWRPWAMWDKSRLAEPTDLSFRTGQRGTK